MESENMKASYVVMRFYCRQPCGGTLQAEDV